MKRFLPLVLVVVLAIPLQSSGDELPKVLGVTLGGSYSEVAKAYADAATKYYKTDQASQFRLVAKKSKVQGVFDNYVYLRPVVNITGALITVYHVYEDTLVGITINFYNHESVQKLYKNLVKKYGSPMGLIPESTDNTLKLQEEKKLEDVPKGDDRVTDLETLGAIITGESLYVWKHDNYQITLTVERTEGVISKSVLQYVYMPLFRKIKPQLTDEIDSL